MAVGSVDQSGSQAFYDEDCPAKIAVTYSFNSKTFHSLFAYDQLVSAWVSLSHSLSLPSPMCMCILIGFIVSPSTLLSHSPPPLSMETAPTPSPAPVLLLLCWQVWLHLSCRPSESCRLPPLGQWLALWPLWSRGMCSGLWSTHATELYGIRTMCTDVLMFSSLVLLFPFFIHGIVAALSCCDQNPTRNGTNCSKPMYMYHPAQSIPVT